MNNYAFGSSATNAPLTPKEKLVQKLTNPKSKVKGKQVAFEASVNRTLGMSHVLNDDEYNMMKGGKY
jgi:hypothetical protein